MRTYSAVAVAAAVAVAGPLLSLWPLPWHWFFVTFGQGCLLLQQTETACVCVQYHCLQNGVCTAPRDVKRLGTRPLCGYYYKHKTFADRAIVSPGRGFERFRDDEFLSD